MEALFRPIAQITYKTITKNKKELGMHCILFQTSLMNGIYHKLITLHFPHPKFIYIFGKVKASEIMNQVFLSEYEINFEGFFNVEKMTKVERHDLPIYNREIPLSFFKDKYAEFPYITYKLENGKVSDKIPNKDTIKVVSSKNKDLI